MLESRRCAILLIDLSSFSVPRGATRVKVLYNNKNNKIKQVVECISNQLSIKTNSHTEFWHNNINRVALLILTANFIELTFRLFL